MCGPSINQKVDCRCQGVFVVASHGVCLQQRRALACSLQLTASLMLCYSPFLPYIGKSCVFTSSVQEILSGLLLTTSYTVSLAVKIINEQQTQYMHVKYTLSKLGCCYRLSIAVSRFTMIYNKVILWNSYLSSISLMPGVLVYWYSDRILQNFGICLRY